jgi:class 3 adenylate cyclase
MNSESGSIVVDAALRFARSNPELLRYAQENARRAGVSVDDLLRDAIDRVVAIRHTDIESSSQLSQARPRLRLTGA